MPPGAAQFDDDVQKVIEHVGKARRACTITYENRIYARRELAKYLAKGTGRSWVTYKAWLHQFDNDPLKVIEHAAAAPRHAPISVTIAGRTFPSQAAFSRHIQTHNYGVVNRLPAGRSYRWAQVTIW
jgi:hypothetical protein